MVMWDNYAVYKYAVEKAYKKDTKKEEKGKQKDCFEIVDIQYSNRRHCKIHRLIYR